MLWNSKWDVKFILIALWYDSKNKTKTTWSIIKTVSRIKVHVSNVSLINVIDYVTNNSHSMANALNKYFLTVAENITIKNVLDKNSLLNNTNPLEYLHNAFKQLVSNIKLKCTTKNKIEEIIKSLKMKNSHGHSGISAKILELSMSYI